MSPRAICDSAQSALSRVLENTTLRMLFIGAAKSSVADGQWAAISRYVTRPMMWVPASRSASIFHRST